MVRPRIGAICGTGALVGFLFFGGLGIARADEFDGRVVGVSDEDSITDLHSGRGRKFPPRIGSKKALRNRVKG